MQDSGHFDIANPFPPHIRRVGLFSPAGIPAAESLARGVNRLQQWGLEVIHGSEGPAARFFSASDAARAETLEQFLDDEGIDALIATRGGYGCARILKAIPWQKVRQRAIPLIGYSDLTAMHAAAFRYSCTANVCGPMICSTFGRKLASEEERVGYVFAMQSLADVLAERPGPCHPEPLVMLSAGSCDGPLLPANLAVLASLVGTAFMPDLSGAILVVEDVNEPAYRVDRCLEQIDASIGLGRLGGLVFGQFTDGEDAHWLPEVFADFATRCSGPVCSGLPFGHAFPSISLPVGRCGRLTAAGDGGQLSLVF